MNGTFLVREWLQSPPGAKEPLLDSPRHVRIPSGQHMESRVEPGCILNTRRGYEAKLHETLRGLRSGFPAARGLKEYDGQSIRYGFLNRLRLVRTAAIEGPQITSGGNGYLHCVGGNQTL